METEKQQELLTKFIDTVSHQASKNVTKQYLFKTAQGFIREKFPQVSRVELRKHARQMANRLTRTMREEVNAKSV